MPRESLLKLSASACDASLCSTWQTWGWRQARLAQAYPDVTCYAGGGVRNGADLRRMKAAGLHGALVASALHDGHLSRDDLVGL